eukprot:m.1046583 g.1046583  ORF g.1046583 m.1046583 type:complete len:76 (+) comp24170_c0_seq130:2263-2490(+)
MPMTVTMEITIPISNLMTWQQPTYVVQDLLLFETELPHFLVSCSHGAPLGQAALYSALFPSSGELHVCSWVGVVH